MRGVTKPTPSVALQITFQPALPMRGVTDFPASVVDAFVFQPALPMRGVTTRPRRAQGRRKISTRTPHAGSDTRF